MPVTSMTRAARLHTAVGWGMSALYLRHTAALRGRQKLRSPYNGTALDSIESASALCAQPQPPTGSRQPLVSSRAGWRVYLYVPIQYKSNGGASQAGSTLQQNPARHNDTQSSVMTPQPRPVATRQGRRGGSTSKASSPALPKGQSRTRPRRSRKHGRRAHAPIAQQRLPMGVP